jgi:hypothetical protein
MSAGLGAGGGRADVSFLPATSARLATSARKDRVPGTLVRFGRDENFFGLGAAAKSLERAWR